jgi:hypothetical protein
MENLTKDDILKIIKYYEEHTEKAHGGSIISYVMKKKLSPNLSGYTKKTTASLKQFGDIPIKKIAIYRTPLHGILNQIVNIISIGKWNELQKKYGFDKFYHLALIVHLENNKTIMIQKLDVIDVSAAFKTASDTEIDYIDNYDANMKLTINDMFANARRSVEDKLWFGYDALYNNCQYFLKYVLENSDLYDAQAQEFLFQNLEELTKELPGYVGKIMNSVTNTAATISNVTGRGKQSHYVLDDVVS